MSNKDVSDKALYRQKRRAELDQWQAEVDSLKAKASGASADAQLKLNKKIEVLEGKVEDGKAKLAEIADASDDAWDSLKGGFDSAWDSLKSAFSATASQFKG